MAIIRSVLDIVFDILRAVILRQLADEVKEWLPWLTQRLILRAVAQLPESSRKRYNEEWSSHVDSVPGGIGKVVNALDFYRGARRMGGTRLAGNDLVTFSDVFSRVVSFGMVGVLLLFLAPLFPLIALAVWVGSNGPILVCQNRVGLNGRTFSIYSFNESGRLGRFLSFSGLSALPHLFSVMRGDMRFVGPRPMVPRVADAIYGAIPGSVERTKVKPGLTGLAVVTIARKDFNLNTELEADLHYIQRRSVWLDLSIVIRTIWQVTLGTLSNFE